MVRKQRSTGRQQHITGAPESVDESWKDDVRAEMRRRGWDQKDLAEQIPVVPASITNMFKPGERHIRFKRRIEELFGWSRVDGRQKELLDQVTRRASRLTLEDLEHLAGLVDSLTKKR